jgi:pimeloyl-ACP methyl ester carboxylesterase
MGHDQSLVGILGEPADASAAVNRPVFIMLNAGLLHHIGQNRLSVGLTRKLQAQGYYVLRFDLSGIGDSVNRRSELSFQERSISEIQEAIDFLQTSKGLSDFILCGLCTGADNAFRTAVVEPRVSGIVMLEGYAYSTAAYKQRKYLKKALQLSAWKSRMQGYTGRGLGKGGAGGEDQRGDVSYHWKLPPKEKMSSDLSRLIDRGVRMLMIYAGNNGSYNYQGQFADAFPSLSASGLLQESLYEKSDHNFSMSSDRECLYEEVAQWISSFPQSGN